MRKIYMFLFITVLVMGLATASLSIISLSKLTKVSFTPDVTPAPEKVDDDFTFDCDGSPLEVSGYEPNGQWEEAELRTITSRVCPGTVTNLMKGELTYQSNKYGMKSFDENELKADECGKDGYYWNRTMMDCHEPVEEVYEEMQP